MFLVRAGRGPDKYENPEVVVFGGDCGQSLVPLVLGDLPQTRARVERQAPLQLKSLAVGQPEDGGWIEGPIGVELDALLPDGCR